MDAKLCGSFCFGAVLGWFIYHTLRYRTESSALGDIGKLVSVIGAGAVLVLFPERSQLFAWYGIGLAAGFFSYFLLLLIFVALSGGQFNVTWFLDGRRKWPQKDFEIPNPNQRAMGA